MALSAREKHPDDKQTSFYRSEGSSCITKIEAPTYLPERNRKETVVQAVDGILIPVKKEKKFSSYVWSIFLVIDIKRESIVSAPP